MPEPEARFPFTTLAVQAWPDPVIDHLGHDPRSRYVERFWLGLLGPSATWLLRRLAEGLDEAPDGFELDVADTAAALGLGRRGGRNGPFARTIERCCYFGMAQHLDERSLRVRRRLAPLTRAQLARLPEPLQAEHAAFVSSDRRSTLPDHAAAVGAPQPEANGLGAAALRQRARALALSLAQLGEDVEAIEAQLHRWRFHPAMAHDAARWAAAEHAAPAGGAGNPGSRVEPGAA